MKYYQFIFTLFFLCFISCDKDDQKAIVPAYLIIDDINVKINSSVEGSSSDQITDAWVFVNSVLIGSFELPAVIPVQRTGNVNIKISAGVFISGMSNNRTRYPFYDFYELDTTLVPDQEYRLEPVVEYKSIAVFDTPWSGENFESGINFEYNDNSQTNFIRNSTSDVFEGTSSGLARLEQGETFFEAFTPTFHQIPRNGSDIYLEMNYKCTHDVVVSVYADNKSIQIPVINLRPKSSWNKIYIQLDEVINSLPSAINFNIAIGYTKPSDQIGELDVDNVKLVHF